MSDFNYAWRSGTDFCLSSRYATVDEVRPSSRSSAGPSRPVPLPRRQASSSGNLAQSSERSPGGRSAASRGSNQLGARDRKDRKQTSRQDTGYSTASSASTRESPGNCKRVHYVLSLFFSFLIFLKICQLFLWNDFHINSKMISFIFIFIYSRYLAAFTLLRLESRQCETKRNLIYSNQTSITRQICPFSA